MTDFNVRDASGKVLTLKRDTHGGLVTLDWEHYMLHEGRMFVVSYKNPNASPVADDATVNFSITTASGKYVHIVMAGNATGNAEMAFYTGATFTGGTTTTAYNRDTNSSTTATTVFKRDVTITGSGTLIYDAFLPGGEKKNAGGASTDTRNEFVLTPSTIYMAVLTNRSGSTADMSIVFDFYEETDN